MCSYSVTGKIPLPKIVKYFVVISDAVLSLFIESVHRKDEKTIFKSYDAINNEKWRIYHLSF
jgi:hypothetical protein